MSPPTTQDPAPTQAAPAAGTSAPRRSLAPAFAWPGRTVLSFAAFVLLATLAFGAAWRQLMVDTLKDALHSYAVGIPFISAWLIWQMRAPASPDHRSSRPSRAAAAVLGLLAVATGVVGFLALRAGWIQAPTNGLSVQMLGWVLAVWAGAFWFFPLEELRRHAFAVAFLIFTVPFPVPLVDFIEIQLQHASAWAVALTFDLTGVTYYRDARSFWIPGFRFEVAQECSGVRSTVVLFITSLVAGKLLLRAAWRRAVLSLAIIPLGIARNTLRICTITLLSAYVDPSIIDSPLHHQGGPLFFAVSLVPLFILLWWLRRQEPPHRAPKAPEAA